ncbi:3'(2'),5'-bisphosphate nucleotidase CysQ, partial [Candidatus Peregrinibacteria bacterium]|nr:3'(2'),5'-bisphosphate nucleotidase CysQ [Candidatus Peregrinibacteria bacterium]
MDFYYKNEFEVGARAIVRAGKRLLDFYKTDLSIEYKDDESPVTKADLASEAIILDELGEFDYPILSEESRGDLSRLEADLVWIVDPLDGTKDFIHHTGDFSVMIGLACKGESVLGLVYKPLEDKLYFAEKGKGAYCRDGEGRESRIKVSEVKKVEEIRLLVSRFHLLEVEKALVRDLGIHKTVESGSAGLKICKVAEGSAELYLNTSDKTAEWDICAADVILNEAGGRI